MLNPNIPLDPAETLQVAKIIILNSPDPGPAPTRIKYSLDPKRAGEWGRRDQWQRPDQTLRLGYGDCEDLMLLWAAHLARKRPIELCVCRTGKGTRHYFLRDFATKQVIDPSAERGMGPVEPAKYRKELVTVVIDPKDFEEQGGAIDGDKLSSGLGTAANVAGGMAGALAMVNPAVGAAAALVAGGLGLTRTILDSSIAEARAKAKKATSKRKRKAALRQGKRVATVGALRLRPATILKGSPDTKVSEASVKVAQDAITMLAAAKAGDERAQKMLTALLRSPMVNENGAPDELNIAVRMAAAQNVLMGAPATDPAAARALFAEPETSAKGIRDALVAQLEAGAGAGKKACCASCAEGKPCEGDDDDGEGDEDDDGEGDEDDDGEGDDDAPCSSGCRS